MPFVTFVGTEDDAQVKGTIINPNEILPMIYNVLQPDNFYPLTGSYMTGGPTYTETDEVTATVRQFRNGRRSDREVTIKEAEVESMDLTVEDAPFPIHMLRYVSRQQRANPDIDWHLITLPRNCGTGCGDQYFRLYRSAKLGGTRETQALWGADITDLQSVSNRNVSVSENFLQYDKLDNLVTRHNSGGPALYGVVIAEDDCEEGDVCPYQKQVVTGASGYARVTLDGWVSNVPIDASVIPVGPPTQDNIVSPILVRGNLIAGFTDVPGGTGTAGGILIATPAADGTFNAFTLATINGAASKGVNKIIQAGSKLYSFGANQMKVSCDFGQSWDDVALPTSGSDLSTQTILDAVFDPNTRNIFIAASNSAWVYSGGFLEITARVRGTSGLTNPFDSVQVLKENAIQFGDNSGNLYTHYQYSRGTNFVVSNVGAASIPAIAPDGYLARSVIALGNTVLIKQPGTEGAYELLHDAGAAVNAAIAADPLFEGGTNYFLAVTDGGLLVELASCDICIQNEC